MLRRPRSLAMASDKGWLPDIVVGIDVGFASTGTFTLPISRCCLAAYFNLLRIIRRRLLCGPRLGRAKDPPALAWQDGGAREQSPNSTRVNRRPSKGQGLGVPLRPRERRHKLRILQASPRSGPHGSRAVRSRYTRRSPKRVSGFSSLSIRPYRSMLFWLFPTLEHPANRVHIQRAGIMAKPKHDSHIRESHQGGRVWWY